MYSRMYFVFIKPTGSTRCLLRFLYIFEMWFCNFSDALHASPFEFDFTLETAPSFLTQINTLTNEKAAEVLRAFQSLFSHTDEKILDGYMRMGAEGGGW
jgi:hypothetical protein